MNTDRMKRWMDAIDADLLEEAQRPLPHGGAAVRWGALAACLCAAALALALWQPWNADLITGAGDNAMSKGPAPDQFAACDAVRPLSATMALPAGAELTSDYDLQRGDDGAVTAVSCTVSLDGAEYAYTAAYASDVAADDALLSWASNGLTLLLYDGSVSWYDSAAGVEWSLSGDDGQAVLNMAGDIIGAQTFAFPSAPAGAADVSYAAFPLDGVTVLEVSFTADGVRWHYRMAPTDDVSAAIPDISAFSGGAQTAEGQLRWCPTSLRWDEGGAGCIIWRDIAPGLVYSLSADSAASEKTLADMAALVFKPAQEES